MAIKGQTLLLLMAFLSLLAASALSVSYQANQLSQLELEYFDMENQFSDLMNEWKALTFERWLLHDLGTYPRNSSPLETTENIQILTFYSNDISIENLTSRFDPLAETFNVTVAYLDLGNQTNVSTLEDICTKTGFPKPNPSQSYMVFLNSSKIIRLSLEQVSDEVFNKCVGYLSLSNPET